MQFESGGHSHETIQRKSRMVEISLSGSGEGPGGAIPRGYSTTRKGQWRSVEVVLKPVEVVLKPRRRRLP